MSALKLMRYSGVLGKFSQKKYLGIFSINTEDKCTVKIEDFIS